jgi:hypothetical protein
MDLPKVPLKLVIPHEEIILKHMGLVMVKTVNLKKKLWELSRHDLIGRQK